VTGPGVVAGIGLRNPCTQLDDLRPGDAIRVVLPATPHRALAPV
jgi:hypothetical protein